MVDVIRNKWCEDLEEILQCPYCMIISKSHIRQCLEGHHVCQDCFRRMPQCPTCSGEWSCTRNLLAEDLCSKFDDIKISLLDPDWEVNKLLIPDKVSIECQTDESAASKIDHKIHEVPQGTYPCRIGTCNVKCAFHPLLMHLETEHPDEFLQVPQGYPFVHTWTFEYKDNATFDWVVRIIDMGTFFLKLSTDVFGDLTGLVLMVENAAVARTYSYRLHVSCCAEHAGSIYYGMVMSCRTMNGIFPEIGLQMKRCQLKKLTDHKSKLQCSLTLSCTGHRQNVKQPQQAKKKNRLKKNRNAAKQPTANDQIRLKLEPSNSHFIGNVRRAQSVSILNGNSTNTSSTASLPGDL